MWHALGWSLYRSACVKVKLSKTVPLHVMELLGGRGSKAATHSRPRHYMGWAVSITPRPRCTPGERTSGTHFSGGWVDPRAGLDTEARGKNRFPCRGSNLDRPVVQSVARHWATPATTCIKPKLIWNTKMFTNRASLNKYESRMFVVHLSAFELSWIQLRLSSHTRNRLARRWPDILKNKWPAHLGEVNPWIFVSSTTHSRYPPLTVLLLWPL
jgi:hypothetical protein